MIQAKKLAGREQDKINIQTIKQWLLRRPLVHIVSIRRNRTPMCSYLNKRIESSHNNPDLLTHFDLRLSAFSLGHGTIPDFALITNLTGIIVLPHKQIKRNFVVISKDTAKHYVWGRNCNRSHSVNPNNLNAVQEHLPSRRKEIRYLHNYSELVFLIAARMATLEADNKVHALKPY